MIGKSERRMARLAHVVLIVFSLMAVLPFILLISASLTEENAALKYGFGFIPKVFSLAAYKYISYQSKMIIRAYGITIFTTVIGTSVGLTMTSMLGYGLSKDIPGRRILNFFVVFTMLFNGGLVPTYLVYTKYLHLGNTIWALIIPSLLMNAFHVMLVRNYFSNWNNWTNGLYYLDDTSLYSIQNVLNAINNNIIAINSVSNMGLAINKSEVPALTARMAIAVIGIVPMLCIYPFFQKYFVKGITIGAVKG